MAIACALSVGNMYFVQPLLGTIARSLGVTGEATSYLPMWTQAGTALGMFSFVPLGDMLPRRGLIVTMCLAISVSAVMMALAPNLAVAEMAAFATGMTAIVPHLILPFAAKLTPELDRGRVLGTIMSGLLSGILLARVFSGFMGEAFGWRSVYWIAACFMLALAVWVRVGLPVDFPESRLGYFALLRSIAELVRTQPVLRAAAVTGGLTFGAFCSFWSTLIFLLSTPPYHYGARMAGLFGLVGAAGAMVAPLAGRVTDRKGPSFAIAIAISTAVAGWVVFLVAGHWLVGLAAGIILLDLGVQGCHVANQTRIYQLAPEARSRLNTVYMVTYFIGGAVGSAAGAFAWNHFGWSGVCAVGLIQVVAAFVLRGTRQSKE
ncbi:MAG: major facilitator superfamily transporter [Bryobacterales bacterium]|nr:major facilitator superfamily transporter [Bryobacterales bacterium]